jgi:hypothetical protein
MGKGAVGKSKAANAAAKISITCKARDLAEIYTHAAVRDVRYYLNGICIERAGEGIVLVATDGHRMAIAADAKGAIEGAEFAIVALEKTTLTILRNADEDERVRINFDAGSIYGDIRADSLRATKKHSKRLVAGAELIRGKFPDWRKVVPQKLKPCGIVDINPRYMAEAGNALPSKIGGVRCYAGWQNSPHPTYVIVDPYLYPHRLVLVMGLTPIGDALPAIPGLELSFVAAKNSE